MITTIISPTEITIPPGSVLRIPATWQDYQQLAEQRGGSSIPRLKYRNGELLLMSPMPAHGRDASLLAQIVITLLDHQVRDYDAFTPVTMDLPESSGIEPDYCFYIDNWPAISGKTRINWQQDPPPDLAIEIDITSYSDINDYLPYRVPEVWFWRNRTLRIYQLQDDSPQGPQYILSDRSQIFPTFDLPSMVKKAIADTYSRNSSFAIRNLRQVLASQSET